ncbi:MAG: hypothetical protein LLG04_09250 [Parachlamydia sp.]|nr:hypothetical protein [Parachlamydia sp.]
MMGDLHEILAVLKKDFPDAQIATISMHWNDPTEQYRMRLVTPSIFVQEYSEKEVCEGAKDVFDCGSVMALFKGLNKTEKKKFKLVVIPID